MVRTGTGRHCRLTSLGLWWNRVERTPKLLKGSKLDITVSPESRTERLGFGLYFFPSHVTWLVLIVSLREFRVNLGEGSLGMALDCRLCTDAVCCREAFPLWVVPFSGWDLELHK